ncbi:hypothetical protein SEA_LUCKYSOCKE_165 [Streptomyces phage LuckySocke]|jgi:hypothetical protein|nr:hypothetical protein SEA_ALONE_167 [Streptomyces phage Alone3]WPH58903.1 hypothetical protein SEA_LUCKYSOCKE_165 [Streptomyces phage LuckySocke]
MAEEQEDTFTYEVELSVATRYIGSEVTETVSLWEDFGISDQEWDEMGRYEQDDVICEYLNDWVWNQIDSGWEIRK